MSVFEPEIYNPEKPLVSVLVYNYNYGRYLKECLESIASQTYTNIEIIFSDNASSDDSWDIAQEFVKTYPGLMTMTRNRTNMGVDANFGNCVFNIRGKYFINMCSDDMIEPSYIEKCVKTMEENPQLGFVMVHRAILDKDSNREEEAPFYNQSCIIEGHDQASVYMMAAVNPSVSQIMYETRKVLDKSAVGTLASRWYGTRLFDFRICMEYPIAYIKEALLLHRIHGENDSLSAANDLLEVIGPYVLHYQFADTANNFGAEQAVKRLPDSILKLSKLSLRYCIRAIVKNQISFAKRYFHLALAMSIELENDEVYKKLELYWSSEEAVQKQIIDELNDTDDLIYRTVSYEPPENRVLLSV